MPRPNPFLLITMLFWGYNFVSIKVLNERMSPASILFCRYFVMWGVLVLICWTSKISLKIPKQHIWRILFAGFNSMGVYMILFMEGVKRSGAGESAIILATSPIMVAVGCMMLKYEKFSWARIIGGVIALTGVTLVVLGRPTAMGSESHLWGDVLLFLSAISWAWSVILVKPISSGYKPIALFTMSMLGGLPLVFAYGLLPSINTPFSEFETRHWLNFAQIAFGSGVIAMVCYYKGITQLPASLASMHQFLVPILATGFAAWFLGERLAWVQAIGVVVLLVGILLAVGVLNGSKTIAPQNEVVT
jgi:drug/metabolite transporter (DMT)-like permease